MHVLTLLMLIVIHLHNIWERRVVKPHEMLLALNSIDCHAETYLR